MSTEHHDVATQFTAMAGPCAVLVDTADASLGAELGRLVEAEALRIEAKYSRYRPSVITHINENAGRPVVVDDETADLFDYATACYTLSDGRFDITSGALRRVWRFDGAGTVPTAVAVMQALAHVGWRRVRWERPLVCLQPGMEIDFGGIGKEYAVDRALARASDTADVPILVNLGGDLRVSGPRQDGAPWRVALEHVDHAGTGLGMLALSQGALATSGDTYRYILDRGTRYGHVLDPLTGWPVEGAPRSVTVHAGTCSEAGLLAKLALMRGAGAEEFLQSEHARAWCIR